MRHRIDPKVDCVFKALLGAEENLDLLIHFINAALATVLPTPIVKATILNPYNEREFESDKLSVVDVKASDDQGRLHQIELQMVVRPYLPLRMLYGWADLYSSQLQKGGDYQTLKPTYAIWLLVEDLFPRIPAALHHFSCQSTHGGLELAPGGIRVLELNKFCAEQVETELERWIKFFKEGEDLMGEDLPEWMQTAEMTKAMDTLRVFSDKELAYYRYQARQNFLREQRSIQRHTEALEADLGQALVTIAEERAAKVQALAAQEQALAAQEQERVAKEQALAAQEQALAVQEQERAEKEAALAEIERLKAKLAEREG